MKIKLLFFLTISTSILFSCAKEMCKDMKLPVYSLEEEYDCVNTKYQMEINLAEESKIIRNQSSFEDGVSGSCNAIIDFSKYDLIVGKKGLSNGNVRIEYDLQKVCGEDDLQLNIVFFQNETTEAPNLTYHALIDKLGDEERVEITIEEKFE